MSSQIFLGSKIPLNIPILESSDIGEEADADIIFLVNETINNYCSHNTYYEIDEAGEEIIPTVLKKAAKFLYEDIQIGIVSVGESSGENFSIGSFSTSGSSSSNVIEEEIQLSMRVRTILLNNGLLISWR